MTVFILPALIATGVAGFMAWSVADAIRHLSDTDETDMVNLVAMGILTALACALSGLAWSVVIWGGPS